MISGENLMCHHCQMAILYRTHSKPHNTTEAFVSDRSDQYKFTFGNHFGMAGEKSRDSVMFKAHAPISPISPIPYLHVLLTEPETAQALSADEFETDVWSGALVEPPFDPSVRPPTPSQERETGGGI